MSIILIVNIVVKLLGFVRESAIARAFGTADVTDAYVVAYTIPNFLQNVVGFALVAAVVPLMLRWKTEYGEEESWRVGSNLINSTALIMAVLTVLGILVAPWLVSLLAPGFAPELAALAASLTRIMMPSLLLMCVAMVITGLLNAEYVFGVPAAAPGVCNILIILSVIFLAARFGVQGLAWGTLAGFAAYLLIQLPLLKMIRFRYTPSLDLRHPAVRTLWRNLCPIMIGLAVNQVYYIINRIFASDLSGAISALNFANKLMLLPLGVFVAAITSAIYPLLTDMALEKNWEGLRAALHRGLLLISLIAIPATAGLMVLRMPVVRLLFEGGQFDYQSSLMTAQALFWFVLGMFPVGANMLLARACFAMDKVKAPLVFGLISIVVNVALSPLLFSALSTGGLALANSLAALSNAAMLYLYLHKLLPGWEDKRFFLSIGKMLIASLLMYGVVWLLRLGLEQHFSSGSTLDQLVLAGVGVVAGVLVYTVAALLLKTDAALDLWQRLRAKLSRRPA